jgi:hypothetical protein
MKRRKTQPMGQLPDGTPLHEHLVRQTLKMNPDLAGGIDPQAFIQMQSGGAGGGGPEPMGEREVTAGGASPIRSEAGAGDGDKLPVALRLMISDVEKERRKHKEVQGEIERARKALDKQEQMARRDAKREVINYLARKVRSVEDLDAVLAAHKVFLEEMATSAKEIVEHVAARRRKMDG